MSLHDFTGQYVALTGYANAVLRGLLAPEPTDLWRNSPPFARYEQIDFQRAIDDGAGSAGAMRTCATNPHEFFRTLKREGARALSLHRVRAASVEQSLIERFPRDRSWSPAWYAIILDHAGAPWAMVLWGDYNRDPQLWPRIWRAHFRIARWQRPTPPLLDEVEVAAHLDAALVEIAAFARRVGIGGWALSSFDPALACLRGDAPIASPQHDHLGPVRHARPPAMRLLAAADAAFVFHGKGHWEDKDFNDDALNAEDRRVSNALRAAIDDAVEVGVNRMFA